MSLGTIIAIIVVCAVAAITIALLFLLLPLKHYFKLRFSGAKVSLKDLQKIKNTKENINTITSLFVQAKNQKVKFSIDEILAHRSAGGSVEAVLRALEIAKNADINLSVSLAKAIDLSGKNVVETVQYCLNPKIVESSIVSAMSKNGVEVKMKLSITLKSNLRRALGGSNEDTIIARVEEACISAIGTSESHTIVAENPDAITDSIMQKDLDSGSMFEILSVDCVSCEIGANIKAKLDAEAAENQKRIKVAEYQEESAKNAAKEQEEKVRAQEMKTELARQEAEVPKAFVRALNEGKLSAMDYLTIENLKSDTAMRNAITKNSTKTPDFDDDDFDF